MGMDGYHPYPHTSLLTASSASTNITRTHYDDAVQFER